MRFFYFIPLLCFLACGQSEQQNQQSTTATAPSISSELPADFVSFYQKFHANEAYQISHIQWPLPGVPDRQLEAGEQFTFKQDEWSMQRAFNPAVSGYVSDFTVLGELIIEKIINTREKNGLERRFLKRNDGEWELIYYQGLRPLAQ